MEREYSNGTLEDTEHTRPTGDRSGVLSKPLPIVIAQLLAIVQALELPDLMARKDYVYIPDQSGKSARRGRRTGSMRWSALPLSSIYYTATVR
jgi:hypothetical protein